MSNDEATSAPAPRPDERRRGGRIAVAVAAAAMVLLLGGGAVAWAAADDDGDGDPADTASSSGGHDGHEGRDGGRQQRRRDGRHHHDPLPVYEERYASASPAEQQAADELVADVTATLAAYTDVDAAEAAGYQAPDRRRARGGLVHYLDRRVVREDIVLDPTRPNGLVYATPRDGEPVLLGAFFVTPAGVAAPTPSGDVAVWHSHSQACPDFWAREDEPCLDTRRMLHVWTAGEVTASPRRGREAVPVRVADPFGTPFDAAVEPVP